MSKPPVSAAGGAMLAEGHKSRRKVTQPVTERMRELLRPAA
jgi:hypothetical protein